MNEEFQSPLLERAVTELSRLPGVGRRTALRLALHLLRRDAAEAEALGAAITDMRRNIRYCRECHNISEAEICPICSSPGRDHRLVCVVESVRDVMSIERTGQYAGLYHVLGGIISPMDGVTPDQLEIDSLVERVKAGDIDEVILALGATMEGDTTGFYIYRKVTAAAPAVKVSQLARGMAVGNDLEYTDEITLGRSLMQRTLFSDTFAL
ncbi:MAG: recombination mediator RecR [Pseudoflavonifractor sp.]|nr:recombination mediator RecR [Alloprevotella sp.]MCM1117178.1 recombination mediator RecR [Pseudoflavonifractor sp.]